MIASGDISKAEKVVIMLHGRGGNAENILQISQSLPETICSIAITAPNNQWYPNKFNLHTSVNQPQLDESLQQVSELLEYAKKHISEENIYILGFSQGACLALEFIARNPLKLGGVFALSGGLIGDDSEVKSENIPGTNVFIGCSEQDPFINIDRVLKSKEILENAGASVTCITYPGNSHTISEEELEYIKSKLSD